MAPEISLIIPCYNEEKRLPPLLAKLEKFAKKHPMEVIFVDNKSQDRTCEVINGFRYGKTLIRHDRNRGKGASIKSGVKKASGRYIIFMDADGSISPDQIPAMASLLKKNDVVVSSRVHEKSSIPKPQPLYRIFAGKTFNLIANILFGVGIHDMFCGFKGFRKDVAKKIFREMKSDGWIFDVEMFYLCKIRGYTVRILPIEWSHAEEGKINLFTTFRMFYELLRLRLSYL